MALGTSHKLVEDTPSEMVRVSRKELNKLMDVLAQLVDDLEGSVDFAGMQAAMTANVQPLVASLRKVLAAHERPVSPE